MSSFQQVYIGGYPAGGLITDRKPFLVPDQAWTQLFNSYCWRHRVKKREGVKLVGRLQLVITNNTSLPNANGSSTYTIADLFSAITPAITGSTVEIAPNSLKLTFTNGGNHSTFVDQGNGTFLRDPAGGTSYQINTSVTESFVNYVTGQIQLTFTVVPPNGSTVTVSFFYYPTLPVTGILRQDLATEGIDNTVYFDTTYSYAFATNQFQRFPSAGSAITFTGNQTDMFWGTNFQGATGSVRTLFITNNNITLSASTPYDPIYYINSSVGDWTALQPQLDAVPNFLYQALILIPYYGRLLALNTWEGPKNMGNFDASQAVNYFSRCRFSQVGNPLEDIAWRQNIFGRGGFVDAPTNESIVSAAFFRNTLIVFFEYSTWQLRYLGEYGTPFIWERVSSDFGSNETYSSIVFDKGVLTVNQRGIISASAGGLERIDDQIPETVYSFQISSSASPIFNQNFVHGIRDFEKEVVYWNYIDANNVPADISANGILFPNSVLLYNYKNNTWAQFRDNVTCFGYAQFSIGINWNSQTTYWDSNVSWDSQDTQQDTLFVVSGNQQGFIHLYEYGGDSISTSTIYPTPLEYDPSLSITGVDLTKNPIELTINNHNLQDGDVIYIVNMAWQYTGTPPSVDPGLNNQIYQVVFKDHNTIKLMQYNFTSGNYVNVTSTSTATYLGAGVVSLLPNVSLITKDFNPFQAKGIQFKLSFIDFLFDTSQETGVNGFNIQTFVNSYLSQSNLIFVNKDLLNSTPAKSITNIFTGTNTSTNPSNPCQVTSPEHSLQNGCQILITGVSGTTQVNDGFYVISVVDKDNFTLNGIDATGFSNYTNSGTWNMTNNPFYQYPTTGSDYNWFRFYATSFGQYLRVGIQYDDLLMNQLSTHQFGFELHGMNFWFRPGGRLIN